MKLLLSYAFRPFFLSLELDKELRLKFLGWQLEIVRLIGNLSAN